MKNKILYNYFSDDDFLLITNKITESEKRTSGEIRVSIRESKPIYPLKFNIQEFAHKEFYRLKMDKTRDKTGILLLIVLEQKSFYILADSGINEKVETGTWDEIRNEIQKEFKRGNYTPGILKGIEQMTSILERFFPIKSDDTNELSNKVEIG